MELKDILALSSNIKKVKEGVESGLPLLVSFASCAEKTLAMYESCEQSIVVCADFVSMTEIKQNFEALGKKVGVVTLAITTPQYFGRQDNSSVFSFICAIFDFYLKKTDVLIVLAEALLQKIPNSNFLKNYLFYQKNNNYKFDEICEQLIELGYKRVDFLSSKGEFTKRGDIIDIYPINEDYPIRLDFFGDDLEKINYFDLDDMKNIEEINQIYIYPATFYNLKEYNCEQIINNLKQSLKQSKINGESLLKINDIVLDICEKIKENTLDNNNSFIMPALDFKDNLLTLFDDKYVFYDEPKKIIDSLKYYLKNTGESFLNSISKGELLHLHLQFFNDENNVFRKHNYSIFANITSDILPYSNEIKLRTIGSRKYTFDFKALVNDLTLYQKSNYIVFLLCGDEKSKNNIGEFLSSKGLMWRDDIYRNLNKAQIILSDLYFPNSFSFLETNVIVIGTGDLVKKAHKTQTKLTKTKKKNVFYLPKIGDYVVHDIHGVGKCTGLERLNLNGSEKDYFIIEYKGGDKFYLPSEQASTLSAFLGGEGEPSLNKIGGQEFAKVKERVKKSVQALAIDLVKLYSERENSKGFVYSEGNYLMDEFENAFEYEETHDQLAAIAEIKKDMYSKKIMDRLVCGDVGYGKTEIAIRAAYQAVLDGKQVCFIAPTTILSQQHYNTTKQRTKDFMCNVEVLNRFRSKSQQEEILKKLKRGEIDIICGTHRLLSEDVCFKDLGLLILDEEQRFGVADKEKIKNIKKDVDVLSLSATPIPRTLNMALTGIRDISIIETPPKSRLPIQTYVTEMSESLIEDACKRELARGGQVLIVYNRVETIYKVYDMVTNLLPNARVGVAHGQMPERVLEDTIMKLYDGEFDILVSTTLIESGIDLPLANTLIVLDADKLGLAQLYQLRGRIGRSDRLAYAYFTYNPDKVLTQDAYKRLDAIMEFTELGSGFKIAMRDLEIRGAGNVLGKEQHGHMEKVGYDMYCKLLAQAVREVKGEKIEQQSPIKVDIVCSAYIPEDYMLSQEERIKAYSEISELVSRKDMETLCCQFEECFGKVPRVVVSLMKIALIKNLCKNIDAKRILMDKTVARIYLNKKKDLVAPKLEQIIKEYRDFVVLKFDEMPIIEFDLHARPIDEKLDFMISFLIECTNV